MTTVIMKARSLDSKVTYQNPIKNLNLNGMSEKVEKELAFIKQTILKEVKSLPFYKQKRFLKTLVITQIALLSILVLSNPTLAASIPVNGTLMSELPSPEEVNKFTQWAISTVTQLAYATGLVTGVTACVLYFHPDPSKAKKAIEILSNVVKGTTQIILFPTVMAIIILTAKYFLGDLPFFHLNF